MSLIYQEKAKRSFDTAFPAVTIDIDDAVGETAEAYAQLPLPILHRKANTGETVKLYMASKDQQEASVKSLVRYLINKGCISHVEDPDLRASFAHLGTALPNRKKLEDLDNASNPIMIEFNELFQAKKAERLRQKFYAIGTDGWRRKP